MNDVYVVTLKIETNGIEGGRAAKTAEYARRARVAKAVFDTEVAEASLSAKFRFLNTLGNAAVFTVEGDVTGIEALTSVASISLNRTVASIATD